MKNIDFEKLGNRVRFYRKAANMLQRELADAVADLAGGREQQVQLFARGRNAGQRPL